MSAPPELAARLFRALFSDYDLVAVDGTTIAVPKDGTIPVFTGTPGGVTVPARRAGPPVGPALKPG